MEEYRAPDSSYYDTLLPEEDNIDDIFAEPDELLREVKLAQYLERIENKQLLAKQRKIAQMEMKVEHLKRKAEEKEMLIRSKLQSINFEDDRKEDPDKLMRENSVKDLLNFTRLKNARALPKDKQKFDLLLSEIKNYIDGEKFISRSNLNFLYDYGLKDKMIENLELYEDSSEEFQEEQYEYEYE